MQVDGPTHSTDTGEPPAGSPKGVPAEPPAPRSLLWEVPIVLVASTLLMYAVLINHDWVDQHFFCSWAERILEGQMPYRDFFMHLWPGHAYALSGWFFCFGISTVAVQWLLCLCNGLSIALAFGIASSLVKGPLRWLAAIGAAAHLVVGGEGLTHMTFATPTALAAIWVALFAERRRNLGLYFLSGAFAAGSGLFTQTIGVWLGFGLVVAAATGPLGWRIRGSLATALGGLAVVGAFMGGLWCVDAFDAFYYDCVTWSFTRYTNWATGIHWGGWMPAWSMLDGVPAGWLPSWFVALLVCRVAVWVLPLLPLVSAVLWLRRSGRLPGRRLLWVVCLVFFVSAWPFGGTRRLVRLSVPVWILIAFECGRFSRYLGRAGRKDESEPEEAESIRPLERRMGWALTGTIGMVCIFVLPMQYAYWDTMVEVDTPRGRTRLKKSTATWLEIVGSRIKPGEMALFVPPFKARFLLGIRNPTGFDALMPVYHSPQQLAVAVQQMEAAGRPPVIHVERAETPIEKVIKIQGTTKYLDEFTNNPLSNFVNKHYFQKERIETVHFLHPRTPPPSGR